MLNTGIPIQTLAGCGSMVAIYYQGILFLPVCPIPKRGSEIGTTSCRAYQKEPTINSCADLGPRLAVSIVILVGDPPWYQARRERFAYVFVKGIDYDPSSS